MNLKKKYLKEINVQHKRNTSSIWVEQGFTNNIFNNYSIPILDIIIFFCNVIQKQKYENIKSVVVKARVNDQISWIEELYPIY